MSEDEFQDRRNRVCFRLIQRQKQLEEVKKKKEQLESLQELHEEIENVHNSHFSEEIRLKCKEAKQHVEKAEKVTTEMLQEKAPLEKLKEEPAQLTEKKQEMQHLVDRYSVYQDFMEQPVKYTKFKDSVELAATFEKLLHFREKLYQKEMMEQEKQSQQRKTLQELEEQHQLWQLQVNNELSQLQAELDRNRSKVTIWYRKWNHIEETAAKKMLRNVQVRMATLNMHQKTGGTVRGEDGMDMLDIKEQMDQIRMVFKDGRDILKRYQASVRNALL
ncbi:coiled-coil domain-containing protein 42A-like [Stegastes partitus]|uniref:Coiled-coil domain-containing protein 42A-like n=1 Tax=Stegastes partitus TaxID=144197 RepID=A0A9Y4TY09_9TELE|nr:PREDICTED: coiled-coil domain-containing protein 42A-like [Stegastes partitus]